ncbi:hypothetical protein H1Z61_16575 [Bacillus aquiflavi]|uniref:Uncharacterized protein n=1 Tax=Bacillus aquiflavi TaxID=2672567 RepID=A0A6B3W2T6_9BACI|nr:hypothetical protein [Bacillus aquiflavi]MBA4538695.1 hypothetical protein [Bacillus aquiflavi]NEY83055.1 hypothetical protein [Bacillus aquiflavi]UAC49161.1 hypothetical protein K6959_04540 [Bacillus aquiflavi]
MKEINRKEFLKLVSESKFYKLYHEQLMSENDFMLTPLLGTDSHQYGWRIQYELKTKTNDKLHIQFTSTLTFEYIFKTAKLTILLTDYTSLLKDNCYHIHHLNTDQKKIVDISADVAYKELFSQINNEKTLLHVARKELNNDLDRALCWRCTQYQYGGGYYKNGIYIPKWKKCIKGYWSDQCIVR